MNGTRQAEEERAVAAQRRTARCTADHGTYMKVADQFTDQERQRMTFIRWLLLNELLEG